MTTCTLCERRDVVYVRVYSGERLCPKCFTESIEDKVRATIAKYDMLEPNDRIAIAVSGGKDSLTLLYILAKIEKEYPRASMCAVTVDEGIKGYRDEAVELASDSCTELGVEHSVVSFEELFGVQLDDLVKKLKELTNTGDALSPCSYCGVLRRRALNLAARKAKVDKLVLAHNLDDEAQTILLNIMHGDAARLARAKPVLVKKHQMLVPRVKPFLEVPEKEIAFYAYLKKIGFQTVPCPYAPSALRNDVRAMLNRVEEKHPGTKFTVLKSIERIQPGLVAAAEEKPLLECRICGEPTSKEICQPCEMLRKIGIRLPEHRT